MMSDFQQTLGLVLTALAATPLALFPNAALAQPAPPVVAPLDGRNVPSAPQAEAPAGQADAASDETAEGAPLSLPRRFKVVVVPVQVGAGALPGPGHLDALKQGLATHPDWDIVSSGPHKPLPVQRVDPIPPETGAAERARWRATVEGASGALDAAAFAALEEMAQALRQRRNTRPWQDEERALFVRCAGLLISAHLMAGREDAAKEQANEVAQLLPGRTLGKEEGLSPVAATLVASPSKAGARHVNIFSNPPGCRVVVNDQDVGAAPITLSLRVGAVYYALANCPPSTDAAGFAAGPALATPLKKLVVLAPGKTPDPGQDFVLDAAFGSAFKNDGDAPSGPFLQFEDAHARRRREQGYARRLAEWTGADLVVFASLGELAGSRWLNARVIFASGHQNRQGLARVELDRIEALGRYLANGKDSDSIETSAEAAARVVNRPRGMTQIKIAESISPPWYTDWLGWGFVAAGAIPMGLGLWGTEKAADYRAKAEGPQGKNDPFFRQDTRATASHYEFWGDVGLFGGAALIVTGVVLLATPETPRTQSTLFSLSPTLDAPGLRFNLGGRF